VVWENWDFTEKFAELDLPQVGSFWVGKAVSVGKDYQIGNFIVSEIPLELSTEQNLCLLDTQKF